MRFPSLFRTPRHQQFHIQPRYYDPVKEEIQQRVERIKQEMEGKAPDDDYRPSIEFKRQIRKSRSATSLQMIIALGLAALVFGWLELGNDVFYYLFLVAAPIYILYRLKSRNTR